MAEGLNAEHFLAILRAQPEFQHFQRKSELLHAVADQVDQRNRRVMLLVRQNWEEFKHMIMTLMGEEDRLPPLVVAGTSPLGGDFERAPSTSVTPRISQLQSEPHIPHNDLDIASVLEPVEPTEHLLAILRAQPEFQHCRRKSELLLAVADQVDQKNPRVLLLLRQNLEEFKRFVLNPTEEGDPLPPLVAAGTSPLESSLGEEDIERAPSTSVIPRVSQLQTEPHIPHNDLDIASVPESVDPTDHLCAILRTQPEFQHFQRKSKLLHAVFELIDQGNPRVLLLRHHYWDEFQRMYISLAERDTLPPLVVAGTSPLESSLGEDIERVAAPSPSVIPRISQLQSEPRIPHNSLTMASLPESVEPYGATIAQETEVEVRRTKRPKDQKEDQKGKKTKVDKKVEETKIVCKICMDEEVGVVFLPCGHLVSCPRCAERISNCPMCRKQITGTVRTYMS